MASPRLRISPLAMAPRAPSASPAGGSPVADEAIWKRLREAGFDEDTVKRRDKAALIAYITKLESEIYDYQYHMGLHIMENKEWKAKYEQIKTSAETAEIVYKRDQAAHLSALAEARKHEENLKRDLGIEKECVANLEKTLHDLRAESAESKIASEMKLAEARVMMETAEKKFDEAEKKLHEVEYLQAEANRCHNTAMRKLQDVVAREDELRRRIVTFQSECDAKEKELSQDRKSLYDSQKILHREQETLRDGQALLNQREEYIIGRMKDLTRFEKEQEAARTKFKEECRVLEERKSKLELDMAAHAMREEAIIKREYLLERRERELLILQEKVASKEYDNIQRLKSENQTALEKMKREFEAEMEERRKSLEDDLEARRTVCDVRGTDLTQKEAVIQERENSIKLQLEALANSREDLEKKFKLLEEKEQNLHSIEEAAEKQMLDMQKKREQIEKMEADLEKTKLSLEDENKAILHAQEKLELTIEENNDVLVLETRLKEEIDGFRAQKRELDAEAAKLKAEKEKFESEWELMDEKRAELQKETERVAEERKSVATYLRMEHDSIKAEKDNLLNQFMNDIESLSRERKDFMSKMEHEHADWFTKIQQEREDFIIDINIQRKELENHISKRKEEIETYLREREEAFEQEKAKEIQDIDSRKEMIAKELEHVASEMKRLDKERMEIALDREQREREWSEIKLSIEVLNIQREKLQKQRELLHLDREEIDQKTQLLKKLEHLNIESECKALYESHPFQRNSSKSNAPVKRYSSIPIEQKNTGDDPQNSKKSADNTSSPGLATLSWVRKCAGVIFKRSPESFIDANYENNVESKSSTESREMAAGNGCRSSMSDLLERKKARDGKRANGSKLKHFESQPAACEEMRSHSRERTGTKETMTVVSDMEESYVILNSTSMDENVENIPNVELENGSDKNASQLKEENLRNMIEDASKPTDNGVSSPILGKKRLNNSISSDHTDVLFEPSQKHRKRATQKESAFAEEMTSKSLQLNQ